MKTKFVGACAALLFALTPVAAQAATIVFNATGIATGVGPTGLFNNAPISVTAVADTGSKTQCMNAGTPIPNCSFLVNTSLTFELVGVGSTQLINPSISILNGSNQFAFAEVFQIVPDIRIRTLLALVPAPGTSPFVGYDLVSDVGPFFLPAFVQRTDAVPGPIGVHRPILTNDGDIIITQTTVAPGSFRATLVQSAVPEPATWAMMIMGFGLIGAATRKAKRPSTALA